MRNFDETLTEFGIENLRNKIDLCLDADGNIAVTRDGDLKIGNDATNGLFRLVERWRKNEATIEILFERMLIASSAAKHAKELSIRFLTKDQLAYQESLEDSLEQDSITETLGGSICVLYNNLLQRFREDLQIGSKDPRWHKAKNSSQLFSFGEVISAAANNFRHSDEWCAVKEPSSKQDESIKILASILDLPSRTNLGFHSIRKNVCADVLLKISDCSLENLHRQTFDFAKMLCKYK